MDSQINDGFYGLFCKPRKGEKIDVTNKTKVSESEVKAKKLGLGEFLAKNKSQTGSVTIISPSNGKILGEYRNNTNLSDYTSVLNSAISQR